MTRRRIGIIQIFILAMILLSGCATETHGVSPSKTAYFVVAEVRGTDSYWNLKLCKYENGAIKTLDTLVGNYENSQCRLFDFAEYLYVVTSNYHIANIRIFDKATGKFIGENTRRRIEYIDICGQISDGLVCQASDQTNPDNSFLVFAVFRGKDIDYVKTPKNVYLSGSLQNRFLLYRDSTDKSIAYFSDKLPKSNGSVTELYAKTTKLGKNESMLQMENNPFFVEVSDR